MKKTHFLLLIFIMPFNAAIGQTGENYSDELLSATFGLFQEADFELARHIRPFMEKRFLTELKDTSSFSNPYDSLSKYITIKKSVDNALKLYCWNERNQGCKWVSKTFAQFQTQTNGLKLITLDDISADYDEDLYLNALHTIEINGQVHYLVIGTGGLCGNHIYQIARVFKILNNILVKCDSIFDQKNEIYAGANRRGNIDMRYSAETKTLSYNDYIFDDDIGFYTNEKKKISWILTKKGFLKTEK